ncbi:MAG TPA: T9SS type A sorting domain-containing protein [Parafilimonas sp.]|nr:T9SS type A sorting domain-containing protein [Parafilimonas sp.]
MNDNISYTSTTIEIVRITSDGTLDWYTTFDSQQSSTDIYNPKCIVEANNEFLIGGNINYQWLYYTDGALLRLNSKGKVLAFKRISSHYLFLTLSKLWIANNMLCAFGEFEGEYGYYKKCFFYFKDTSGQIHGDVVHNNVFSVQHYLELHKYLLPADLSGAYYEKNGSYINVAGNGYNYEISKFDSLGRICPDFALPKYDPLFHSKLFTTSDKSYAVYTDSVYLEDAEVSESRVAEEAIICRGSANENPNPIKLDNQRVNVDGSKPMLFPNPARDIITLKYSSTSFQEVYVAITTSDGITMQSAKLLLNPGINMQPIGIESLSSGLYLLRIKEHDKLTVLKFIKSN